MSTLPLSGDDLCKYLKPLDAALPLRGGRKEYSPDGSWLQRKRTETIHSDRNSALTEEKCSKIGSVSVGEWLPQERRIKVNKEVGKMWATMGYSDQGIKYLDLEEALFLIDEGQMEVYHGGIPLSLQEAYGIFFAQPNLSLEQFQVYSHLLRLGYVCRKHKEEVNHLTNYEKKIGLDKHANQITLKRKYSASKTSNINSGITGYSNENNVLQKRSKFDIDHTSNVSAGQPSLLNSTVSTEFNRKVSKRETELLDTRENALSHTITREQFENSREEEGVTSSAGDSRWDFTAITFPDVSKKLCLEISAPDESLLPNNIQLSKKSYKFDLHQMRISKRANDSIEQIEFSFEVGAWKSSVEAHNWRDYKAKLKKRLKSNDSALDYSPVCHLWKDRQANPLVHPAKCNSIGDLLEAVSVVDHASMHFLGRRNAPECKTKFKIHFDVHKPDSKFKKTEQKLPNFRVCVCRIEDDPPDMGTLGALAASTGDDVPVFYAVVDHGVSSFYSFNFTELPTDLMV